MQEVADDLTVMADYGRKQAGRDDAGSICRLGDDAIVKYEKMVAQLDRFIAQYRNSFGLNKTEIIQLTDLTSYDDDKIRSLFETFGCVVVESSFGAKQKFYSAEALISARESAR
jgi:hypothetical protein